MKQIILVLVLFIVASTNAQTTEENEVKAAIEQFFEAFHQQDSSTLRTLATKEVVLQSISVDNVGRTLLKTEDFDVFVNSIASIPEDRTFEEKLLGFTIKVDGPMANAWTPYEFWYNGNFSHCGVNSFQLIKKDEKWKIIYLVDTRRKEGCLSNKN